MRIFDVLYLNGKNCRRFTFRPLSQICQICRLTNDVVAHITLNPERGRKRQHGRYYVMHRMFAQIVMKRLDERVPYKQATRADFKLSYKALPRGTCLRALG
jgi:hypothetical protein